MPVDLGSGLSRVALQCRRPWRRLGGRDGSQGRRHMSSANPWLDMQACRLGWLLCLSAAAGWLGMPWGGQGRCVEMKKVRCRWQRHRASHGLAAAHNIPHQVAPLACLPFPPILFTCAALRPSPAPHTPQPGPPQRCCRPCSPAACRVRPQEPCSAAWWCWGACRGSPKPAAASTLPPQHPLPHSSRCRPLQAARGAAPHHAPGGEAAARAS